MSKLEYKSMLTKILHPEDEGCIPEAVALLAGGGIVALPTETVYGLAAQAWLHDAVQKIFVAKNRPMSNPLIWHVHDAQAAQRLFDWEAMSETSKRRFSLLTRSFWPGPLTLVATKSARIESPLSTVAVRVPRSEITLKILKMLDAPLVMPSANISSRPSPTCALHVLKTLNGRIDAVIDGGVCEVGLESSVIRIDQERVKILRPGLVSQNMLEEILNEPVILNNLSGPELESPGLAFKHYAPQVERVILIKADAVAARWQSPATILGCIRDIEHCSRTLGSRPAGALTLSLANDPKDFAQSLYGALYRAEDYPERTLILLGPQEFDGSWAAIHDRLSRSSGVI